MLHERTDNVANAVRLIVAMAGFASAPGAKTGLTLYDTIRKFAARPPKSLATISDRLTLNAEDVFAKTHDAPTDADVLFFQMVEIGLLSPAEITSSGMDPSACVEAMLSKLSDKTDPTGEMRRPGMRRVFSAIAKPALSEVLADKLYVAELTPAYMAESLQSTQRTERKIENVAAKLNNIEAQTRDTLEALALRFGEFTPELLSLAELKIFLNDKAQDYRAILVEVESLRGTTPRIDNVLTAVEAAIDALDLGEADLLLASVRDTTAENLRKALEDNAKVMEAQARVSLLRGETEAAYNLFSSAADSFDAINHTEVAQRCFDYARPFHLHGLRYGGDAFERGADLLRRGLSILPKNVEPVLWGKCHNNLGVFLLQSGQRTAGNAGAQCFADAVKAFRTSLLVRTETGHPMNWAMTQDNIGVALREQCSRIDDETQTPLMKEAVEAHRAALRVFSETEHPVRWAMTHDNLASTLREYWQRTGCKPDSHLLAEAVRAHRAALRVFTADAHPWDWATANNNLGNALLDQSKSVEGAEGIDLFSEAVRAFRAALQVRTEADYPVDWAQTKSNLGTALREQGRRLNEAPCLERAIQAYHAALRVYTEANDPVGWAMTLMNLGLTHEAIAESKMCSNPRPELKRAAECVESSLRVYDPEHMAQHHGTSVEVLARILNKINALG